MILQQAFLEFRQSENTAKNQESQLKWNYSDNVVQTSGLCCVNWLHLPVCEIRSEQLKPSRKKSLTPRITFKVQPENGFPCEDVTGCHHPFAVTFKDSTSPLK